MFKQAFAAAVLASAASAANFTIELDPENELVKDQRQSLSAPDLGYAGSMMEFGHDLCEWFFVKDRENFAKMMREGGAYVLKEWNANDRWQVGKAYADAKTPEEKDAIRKRHSRGGFVEDPKTWFSFRKENNMKVHLCLEQYGVYTDVAKGARTNDLAKVKTVICDYLKWILDNGFKDQVAGFELGNEAYFGNDPEIYGARWSEIVPAMKAIWPDAKIGMPLAEYRAGDPDIAAVRARSVKMEWWKDGGEFTFNKFNQWSGRFIVAMSNQLHNISHVIYHFYGADAPYGCSASGFGRIHNFAKVFPEVKDKRVWITEWRERSDENNRCHQAFFSALWKAHYLLSVLAQPNIDGISNHCIAALAGGFYVSNGKTWHVQWDSANRDYADLDGVGHPHLELGPSGPLFRLYCEALMKHPLVIKHGTNGGQGPKASFWHSALYYANIYWMPGYLGSGKDPAKKKKEEFGGTEWVVAMNPEKTSMAILLVNTKHEPWTFTVDMKGGATYGKPRVRSMSCPANRIYQYEIPGEPKHWKVAAEHAEKARNPFEYSVPADTIMTIVVPVKRGEG